MQKPPKFPANTERLQDLQSYNILDTVEEEDFDNLTLIAAQICQTPIALVSLVDEKRQWFKSHIGLESRETPLDYSFCAHGIITPDQHFIIEDARKDERFQDNPLVTGPPHIVFYAGFSLMSEAGYPLGTLCVIDTQTKKLSPDQCFALKALSKQVMQLLELRKKKLLLEKSMMKLKLRNEEIEQFVFIASKDLKSPLATIDKNSKNLLERVDLEANPLKHQLVLGIISSTKSLRKLVTNLMRKSDSRGNQAIQKKWVHPENIQSKIKQLLALHRQCQFLLSTEIDEMFVSERILTQVLVNLVSFILQRDHISEKKIYLTITENPQSYLFTLLDRGEQYLEKDGEQEGESTTLVKEGKRVLELKSITRLIQAHGGRFEIIEGSNETSFNFTLSKK